jgi:hypothetical protein
VQAFENFKSYHIRIVGEKCNNPALKVFKSQWVFISIISTLGGKVELLPSFVDSDKANSLKYVVATNTEKFDKSATGVDAPTVPPQSTMLSCFETSQQNYNDVKQMIEETNKKENEHFGYEIVCVAQKVREKRD